MKTNQNRITLLMSLRICLCVTLLAFASCKSCKKDADPENTLPPATQTGANTFGCVINGQAWVPNGITTTPMTRPINGGYIGESINVPKYSVNIRTYANDRTSTTLYIKSVTKAGRYMLNFNTSNDIGGSPSSNSFGLYSIDGPTIDDTDYNYITTSQITGYVDFVVADTASKRLAGTFEFEGIDFPSGKKIKVTGGRFDIDQKTLNK